MVLHRYSESIYLLVRRDRDVSLSRNIKCYASPQALPGEFHVELETQAKTSHNAR